MDRVPEIASERLTAVPPTLLQFFEPSMYSREELLFFLEHMGESPAVAIHGGVPAGVNPIEVRRVLGTCVALEELRQLRNVEWCGYQKLQLAIRDYLSWDDQSKDVRRRGGPRHPSLYSWDSQGRGTAGGTGSDGGIVRTAIRKGKRVRLGVDLTIAPDSLSPDAAAFVPDFIEPVAVPTEIIHDEVKRTLACPICHETYSYKEGSRRSFAAAQTNMQRHLKKATTERESHMVVWTAVYSATKTKAMPQLKAS